MKINHLDLQVSDVPRTAALFEEVLGLRFESNRTSPAIAILTDGEGFTLVLQRMEHEGESYPDGFHFGFLVDDVARVREFHAKARARELAVSEIVENGRGVQVYWRAPDGIVIEVSCPKPRKVVAA
jgi:catechol 2,3-dioxygenase-like lactoylglutathione lyase family enzyme